MEGAGNDYVYVDCFSERLVEPPATLAPKISDRHYGVGSDGLILIEPSEVADARMRMFNADGSESEMCGNGVRCVAKYVYDHGICRRERFHLETGAGVLEMNCELGADGRVARVRVDMGEPILIPEKIPTLLRAAGGSENEPAVDVPFSCGGRDFFVTCVSMGNPHCVVFVEKIDDDWVYQIGSQIEKDPRFPRRVNAEFVEVLSRNELRMRVWERGAGETFACGTGACATAVAAVLSGRADRRATIHLRGGDLEIEWTESNRVLMTGPAREVFHGEW